MTAPLRPPFDPTDLARAPDDPVGEVLHVLKLTGTFYCQARLTAPWGIEIPAFDEVMTFAAITSGRCWLNLGDAAPLELRAGHLVLLTSGVAHCFRSAPDVPAQGLDTLPVERVTDVYETLDFGGGGDATTLMYGVMRMDHAASGFLRESLPDVVAIDVGSDESGTWLQSTLGFIAREAQARQPGGEALITRLADIIVIDAIRRWMRESPEADSGWLKGVRDPQLGRAILAIHRAPHADWSVAALARIAGLSRSAFAARFTESLGLSAMRYVTLWRMRLARERLRETPAPISAIAAELGYESEPAFSRAFKRVFGQTPGQARRVELRQ